MNDIADKIWAAIQRPSPPVTKDEIVALVNEGAPACPRRYEHTAGPRQTADLPVVPELTEAALVELAAEIARRPDVFAMPTRVVYVPNPDAPALHVPPSLEARAEALKLGGIPVTVDDRLSGDDWYLVTAKP